MKRLLAVGAGAALGVAWLLVTLRVVEGGPRFPSPAGEDDFALRAAWAIGLLIPGFAVLGAWIGAAGLRARRAVPLGVAGVLGATVAFFAALRALGSFVARLSSGANAAAVGAMIAWLALATVGAAVGVRRARAR